MKIQVIRPESPTWLHVIEQMRHDFYHLPAYMKLCMGEQDAEPIAFIAQEDDWSFFLPLIIRQTPLLNGTNLGLYDATSPYGYPSLITNNVSDNERYRHLCAKAIQALLDFMQEKKVVCGFFRMHPLLSFPSQIMRSFGLLVQHGETVFADLTLSEEELWRQIRSGHRNEINRAKKRGYCPEIDASFESISRFHEIYTQTMKRVGATPEYFFSRDYFESIARTMHDVFRLCVVKIDGEIACGGLFSETCGIVQYHLSGTSDEYARAAPTKVMLYFMLNWAREHNDQLFHFGGGTTGDVDDPLFRFKSGFSKLRAPFYTWRVIADQANYERLKRCWERETGMPAAETSDYFPCYRKPIPSGDSC